jgi:hypothetical protein
MHWQRFRQRDLRLIQLPECVELALNKDSQNRHLAQFGEPDSNRRAEASIRVKRTLLSWSSGKDQRNRVH